jgi:glucokinase
VTSLWGAVAIGGTRSTVALARTAGRDRFDWVNVSQVATSADPGVTLAQLTGRLADQLGLADTGTAGSRGDLTGIGVVCGSPLDEQAGLVLAPPNLPHWAEVDVLTPFASRFGVRPVLLNDADAGALAEWAWGAGRGARSVVFLTMGTGLGAGLILDGRLYRGATGLAGEIGHWRLAAPGPAGQGKAGSFEGFCAGSGIGRQAQQLAAEHLSNGSPSALAPDWPSVAGLTAARAAQAADADDPAAVALWASVGSRLGAGLALLVDLLNPDVIVLGGIYNRQIARLEPAMRAVLAQEALPASLRACRIEPSALGERIGDWSGLAAALLGHRHTPTARLLTEAAPAVSPTSAALARPRLSDSPDGQVRSEGSHQ